MDEANSGGTLGAFLPSKDFEKSREFYEALGFTNHATGDEIALFDAGAGTIILTRTYSKKWDGAFMMALMVDDLAAWWERIQQADLPGRFGIPPPSPPEMQSWGLEVCYVIDPTGILWHFQQRPAD